MAKSLFDHLKGITTDKVPWESLTDEDKSSWSTYMVNRWLSMNMDMTETVDDLQQFTMGISAKHAYQLYYDILPKTYIYMKYTKGTKRDKYNPDLVKLIGSHFQVGRSHAIEYLGMLSKDAVCDIARIYGHTEEEIEQLLTVKETKGKTK